MKQINVYGSGCKNCVTTAKRFEDVASQLGLDVQVTKVTDLQAIMTAGVVSTPAVGINGHIVHAGSVPSDEQVKDMLQ